MLNRIFSLVIACLVMFIAGMFFMGASEQIEFKDLFGVDVTSDSDVQIVQAPIIMVHIGQLRQKATRSWEELNTDQQRADVLVITLDSSLDDAKRKAALISAVQQAQASHRRDMDNLEKACGYLKGDRYFVPAYPAVAQKACP
jgi:hypothetical protein